MKKLFFAFLTMFMTCGALPEKPMVIIALSYHNTRETCERHIRSLCQKYENYRIIYVNDGLNTQDDLLSLQNAAYAEEYAKKYGVWERFALVRPRERQGALYNMYTAVHSCRNEEIVLVVDADDFLAHEEVLAYINWVYSTYDVWMTYGQFEEYPSGQHGWCRAVPDSVVHKNTFRKVEPFIFSHLRTHYAWLFKSIPYERFLYEGAYRPTDEYFPPNGFYPIAGDVLVQFELLERAGKHHLFIPNILYRYNQTNPLSDHVRRHDKAAFQVYANKVIRARVPAKPLKQCPYPDGLKKISTRQFYQKK